MLIIGAPNVILPVVNINPGRFIIYNLSSNLLDDRIPRIGLQYIPGLDFTQKDADNIYANMIFSNDQYFLELMKIMIPLRDGQDVALLVYKNENFFDPFTETLAKIIQQRYGYNYQLLNSPEDFNQFDTSNFDINGVFNMDMDSNRQVTILSKLSPQLFINEQIDESHF